MKKENTPKRQLNYIESILTGSLAGVAETAVTLPLWTIKTRLQNKQTFKLNLSVLYRGFSFWCLSMVACTVLNVMYTNMIHRYFSHRDKYGKHYWRDRQISTLIGGALSTIFVNPIDVVTIMQHKNNSSSFLNSLKVLVRNGGLKKLYVGYFLGAALNSSFTLGFYGLYPLIKHYTSKYYFDNESLAHATSGIVSGVSVALFTHPIDVVKTIQQNTADTKTLGLISTIKKIYMEDGIKQFTKGIVPRTIQVFIAISVLGAVTSIIEDYLISKNEGNNSFRP